MVFPSPFQYRKPQTYLPAPLNLFHLPGCCGEQLCFAEARQICLSNGTTGHRAVNASLQVHYFKSFQRVLSRLGVICPALFTGQPAPPETALLGRAQREREEPLTATRRLLKGFQTAWEGCSARHSSRASDQRLQRLFLGGAEGPPRTEITLSCTEAVPLPCPADVTVRPLKPLNPAAL